MAMIQVGGALVQGREWIERIEELCKRIWDVKSVEMQEIAAFVQEMNPYLLGILEEDEKGDLQSVFATDLVTQLHWIIEGLQYKDKMFLADTLYFGVRATLLKVEERV